MFNMEKLTDRQMDFFKELENIGASHAATALSQMLNRAISVSVTNVGFLKFNNVCDVFGGPGTLVAGLLVEITEDIKGYILIVLEAGDAFDLSNYALEAMGIEHDAVPREFSQMQISALLELANILSGCYLTAIGQLTGMVTSFSVPKIVIDMAGAVMNLPITSYAEHSDMVLNIETEFRDAENRFSGHFFLIPDADTYIRLIEKMEI